MNIDYGRLEEHAEGPALNTNPPLQLELSNEQTKETNMNKQERLAREWAQSVDVDTLNEEERAVRAHVLATTSPLTMADVEWDEEKHVLAGAVTKKGTEVIMLDLDDDLILARQIGTRELINYDGYELTPNGKKYELREITELDRPVEPSTKTMDEYSPEEQANMIGMWAEYRRGGEPRDFMIIEGGVNQAGRVPCYNPDAPVPHAWAPDPDELIPRFDLPRVWSKDGEPCEPTVSPNEKVVADQPEHPEVLYTLEDYANAPAGTVVLGSGFFHPFRKHEQGVWSNLYGHEFANDHLAGVPRNVKIWGNEE